MQQHSLQLAPGRLLLPQWQILRSNPHFWPACEWPWFQVGEKGFWLGGNHDPELSMVVRQPSRQRDLKRKGGSGAWRRVNNLVGTPQNRFCRWGQNPKEALESNRNAQKQLLMNRSSTLKSNRNESAQESFDHVYKSKQERLKTRIKCLETLKDNRHENAWTPQENLHKTALEIA